MRLIFFLLCLSLSSPCLAIAKFAPFYASIKSGEVNVRRGPNPRYQIDWVFKKKGEPVEVIAKFEHWSCIKDLTGDEGWVNSNMLSKKRTAVIIAEKTSAAKAYAKLYRKPETSAKVFANIEATKRVVLEQCLKQWCKIKVNNVSGWIEKSHLWGVYANEEFK